MQKTFSSGATGILGAALDSFAINYSLAATIRQEEIAAGLIEDTTEDEPEPQRCTRHGGSIPVFMADCDICDRNGMESEGY